VVVAVIVHVVVVWRFGALGACGGVGTVAVVGLAFGFPLG